MKKRKTLKIVSILLLTIVLTITGISCTTKPNSPVVQNEPEKQIQEGTVEVPQADNLNIYKGSEQIPPKNNNNNSEPPNSNIPPNVSGNTNTTPNKVVPNTQPPPSEPKNNSTDVTNTIIYWSEVENYIFTMVNEERSKIGKSNLTVNTVMKNLSRDKSKEMIELNYFDHNSPRNGYINDILNTKNIKYRNVGENIAMQESGKELSSSDMAKQFMNMWMNSSGHKANILSDNFTQIGIGVAKKGSLIEATQTFFTPM